MAGHREYPVCAFAQRLLFVGALVAASMASAASPQWMRLMAKDDPVAAIRVDNGVSVYLACYVDGGPRYVLTVNGPANGVVAGDGIRGVIEGRDKVAMRFWRVTVNDKGAAQLVAHGGLRGSTGNQASALYAFESIRAAKDTIRITSGKFSVAVPAAGVADAMAPLVARCGDIKAMARRAEGRAGEIPQ
jgi:hypothetical protein